MQIEWTPCNTEMPEEDGTYWVTCVDKKGERFVRAMNWVDYGWHSHHGGCYVPIAWSPMPEPWMG